MPRSCRVTREDPFAQDWEEIAAMLTDTPEFEAKTLFGVLMEKYPGRHEPGQLRTLQRNASADRTSKRVPQSQDFRSRS